MHWGSAPTRFPACAVLGGHCLDGCHDCPDTAMMPSWRARAVMRRDRRESCALGARLLHSTLLTAPFVLPIHDSSSLHESDELSLVMSFLHLGECTRRGRGGGEGEGGRGGRNEGGRMSKGGRFLCCGSASISMGTTERYALNRCYLLIITLPSGRNTRKLLS